MDKGLSDSVTIFDFEDYKEFLLHKGLPDGLYSHRSTNLQKWAQRLGYRSPSSLTMILRGDRIPSFQMVSSISDDLKLSKKEKEYFLLLVELEKKKRQKKDFKKTLEKLNALARQRRKSSPFKLDIKAFEVVEQWYHFVIKQLISTEDFTEDLNWIHKRLRKKVSIGQIKAAIENLIQIGVVQRNEKGQLVTSGQSVHSLNDVPSEAVRNHHKSMIERAKESIDEQSIDQRQISGLTFKINPEKVKDAKADIVNFFSEFNDKYFDEDGASVYQLNIQLFEHTKSDSGKSLKGEE